MIEEIYQTMMEEYHEPNEEGEIPLPIPILLVDFD